MIGQTISHYSILEELGEGGMGVVYKARDTNLGRFVAIKVLPAEKVTDPERKQRFVQEAKAASSLNHPNIITIYDIGQAEGVDFIAMECVAGKTLDQLIPKRGMRLHEALKCAIQIADALARAHSAGIVHRDLKPGNIMVNEHGLVKVLDFGLAKLTEVTPADGDESTLTMRPATEEGKIVGTVSYMSPEQAEGKKVDARSDIFSFGSVLYGNQEAKLLDSVHSEGQWTVGKDGIYFFRTPDKVGRSDICFYEFSNGQIRKILTIQHPVDNHIAVSPDGRTILYPQPDESGSVIMLVDNFR